MVLRRAQAQQQCREAQAAQQQPARSRSVFSFLSLFASKHSTASNDLEEVERMKRAA
jgi:hypothetical protein